MAIEKAYFDYETQSEAKLDDVGPVNYAKHPTTRVLCLCMHFRNKFFTWVPDNGPMPKIMVQVLSSKKILKVAHNATFEICITNWVLPRHGVTIPLMIETWSDTAAKAAACGLPRKLEKVAEVLELKSRKDMGGNKLVKKYMKPRHPWIEWDITGRFTDEPQKYFNNPDELEHIYKYCKQDVIVDKELDEALPELSDYEKQVWVETTKRNIEGVRVDLKTIKKVIKFLEDETDDMLQEFPRITKGQVDSPTKRDKFLAWLSDQGHKLPNAQKETFEELLKLPTLEEHVRRAIEISRFTSKTSNKKYYSFINRADENERATDLFMYHGAITGRDAGRGIQLHNFPRSAFEKQDEVIHDINTMTRKQLKKKYGSKLQDVFSKVLRGMVMASHGHTMYGSDFNAVECRVLHWLSNNTEALKDYHQGVDRYIKMASVIYNKKSNMIGKESEERWVGKQTELGCGYGMGGTRFKDQCASYGKNLPAHLCQKAVQAYRAENPKVVECWNLIERAAIKAVQNKGYWVKIYKVAYMYDGRFLWCRLPSGRRLAYFRPQVKDKATPWGGVKKTLSYWTVDSKTKNWVRTSNWGGGLVENICQAISRDLMVNAAFKIKESGFTYLFNVHDELVGEHKHNAPLIGQKFVKSMEKLPVWATGLPIKAGGWSGPRFKKG